MKTTRNTVVMLACLGAGFGISGTHELIAAKPPRLLNDPVDSGGDFGSFATFYYPADQLADFERVEDEYLFASGLLVAPLMHENANGQVFLPGERELHELTLTKVNGVFKLTRDPTAAEVSWSFRQ